MADAVPVYTKEALTARLEVIAEMGWVPNIRHGNHGGIGNTLEQLLGIEENNLPIPNAAEWELKAQRIESSSLTTLFHMEPSPRAMRFVPQILLPKYGWAHQQAGERYGAGEMSFRQTIHGAGRSDRGFMVMIEGGHEYYWYRKVMRLERFSFSAFLTALEQGAVLVDFDARTGHNHGTKFRLRQDCLPMLYERATVIVPHQETELRYAA